MRNLQVGIMVIIVIALFALPQMPFGTKDNLTLMISLFTIASLASSWNILAGLVGHVNLGHVAFFGIGSLTTRILWLDYNWPLLVAFVLGGFAAALLALIVGAPALRLKGIYFSIGTLAFSEAMRLTVGNVLPRVSRLPGPMLRTYDILPRYYLSFVVLLVIVLTVLWLSRSKLGLGMMAVREDEEAARSIGVNTFFHSMLAFVLSAFFAGLAGGTFAFFHVGYYQDFTFVPIWTFDAVIITFIGGIGTISGPIIGALFFVMVRDIFSNSLSFTFTTGWLGDFGISLFGDVRAFEFKMTDYHLVIFGAIFIIVVLTLPGGLIELWDRLRVQLFGSDAEA